MENTTIEGKKSAIREAMVVVCAELRSGMDQNQAAALAVLMSDMRRNVGGWLKGSEEERAHIAMFEYIAELLEQCGVGSIEDNDGEVVQHIGYAAKQMNPLLVNS